VTTPSFPLRSLLELDDTKTMSSSTAQKQQLAAALKQVSPNIDNGRLLSWATELQSHGIASAHDIAELDAATFDELSDAVKHLGLPMKAALRKIRDSLAPSPATASATTAQPRSTTMPQQQSRAGGVGIGAATFGAIAMSGVGNIGEEQRAAVGSAVMGAVVKHVAPGLSGAVAGGVGDLASQLAMCHAALQVTLGILNEIRRMCVQAKANREKCVALAKLVGSLQLPLHEVGRLMQSNAISEHRAPHISNELESTQSAVTEARAVLVAYVEIRDKKGFIMRVKEVLISGRMAEEFQRVSSAITLSYDALHKLLGVLAAVDALGRGGGGAPALAAPTESSDKLVAEANQLDLHNLHKDLVALVGGQRELDVELHAVGWKVDELHRAVASQLERIEVEIKIMSRELSDVKHMIQTVLEQKARETKRSAGAAFANAAAAPFWEQHVMGIVGDSDSILWADFAATVFNLLAPLGINKPSWLAIEPTLRAHFDANRDNRITRAEYDKATSKPRAATVLELCYGLLLQVQQHQQQLQHQASAPAASSAASSRKLNRSTTVLSSASVQEALAAERARVGPNYLPMTKWHAALVAELSADFGSDAKTRYAFMCVPRRVFAPEPLPRGFTEAMVYENRPISDGGFWHQSQPKIYAAALRHMRIDDDLGAFSFLCIGSGSGYFNAMVAVMQNWRGLNCGVEIREEMVTLSRTRLAAFCHQVNTSNNITIRQGNAFVSLSSHGGTFDRIYVAAAVDQSDLARLCALLSVGGIMLVPVNLGPQRQGLLLLEKRSDGSVTSQQVEAVSYRHAIKTIAHPHALAQTKDASEWVCDNCKLQFGSQHTDIKRFRCVQRCDFDFCGDCHAAASIPIIQWR
jgi:protein-L-isoaspartate(D-aspartate) O-methyltransferase